MNRKIIQKLIDELTKETPRLDYIRGILETLLESLPEEKPKDVNIAPMFAPPVSTNVTGTPVLISEAEFMEQEARNKLKGIQATINKSLTIE